MENSLLLDAINSQYNKKCIYLLGGAAECPPQPPLSYANVVKNTASGSTNTNFDVAHAHMKQTQDVFGMTSARYDAALAHCMKQFPLLAELRPIVEIDIDAITLILNGVILLPQLPTFLWQCLTLSQIEKLMSILNSKNSQKLYLKVPTTVRLDSTLTFYGILRQIGPKRNGSKEAHDLHDQFKRDVDKAEFNATANILSFRFRNASLFNFWKSKFIAIRGVFSQLREFLPAISDMTSEGLQLRIQEDMNYVVTFLKVDPVISFSSFKHFLETELKLPILKLEHGFHPISKTIDLTSWEVTINSFDCPSILFQKTRINIANEHIFIKHNRFFENAPCWTCISACHSQKRCPSQNEDKFWTENMLIIPNYVFNLTATTICDNIATCSTGQAFLQTLHSSKERIICPATPPRQPLKLLPTDEICCGSVDAGRFPVSPITNNQEVTMGIAAAQDKLMFCSSPELHDQDEYIDALDQPPLVQHELHSHQHHTDNCVDDEPPSYQLLSSDIKTPDLTDLGQSISISNPTNVSIDVRYYPLTLLQTITTSINCFLVHPVTELLFQGMITNILPIKFLDSISANSTPKTTSEHCDPVSRPISTSFTTVQESATAGPIFSLQDQLAVISGAQRKQEAIPGMGQCLWMALYAAKLNDNIFSKPLSQAAESHFSQFKQSIYDHLLSFLPQDIDDVHIPFLDLTLQDTPPKTLSVLQRLECIKTYFTTIIDTPSTGKLEERFWGTTFGIELIASVLQQPVYVLEFNSAWNNSILHQFLPQKSPKSTALRYQVKYSLANFSDWVSILRVPKNIILQFTNRNHYQYLSHRTGSTSASEKPISKKQVSIGQFFQPITESNSHFQPPSSTTHDDSHSSSDEPHSSSPPDSTDPLEHRLALLPTSIQHNARQILDSYNIQDVYLQAETNNISPLTASKQLEDIAIVTAQKQAFEDHLISDSCTPLSETTTDDQYIPSSSVLDRSPILPEDDDHPSQLTTFLKSTVVLSLLPVEEQSLRKTLLEWMLTDLIASHKSQLASSGKLLWPPVPITKISLKFYFKWSTTNPQQLLELLHLIPDRILFLRQLPKTALLDFGEYLYVQQVISSLGIFSKRADNPDLNKYLKQWSHIINTAPTHKTAFVLASALHRWQKLALWWPQIKPYMSHLPHFPNFRIALILNAVFPKLFGLIEVNETYNTMLTVEDSKQLLEISSILRNSEQLQKVISRIKSTDWSGVRLLLQNLEWPHHRSGVSQRC